ncbi:GldM family protein [Flavobacterium filum]|uniref:GldM family protein n=1 Tax=Flavobacterium TaxID=237 RepID=UPI0009FE5EFF|nr:GldM family protein [Flavobacterium filum]
MKKILLIFCLLLCHFILAQNDTVIVSKPKIGVISVDKLNVVYRGIQNPISIAVPNAKSFTVSGLGVKEENGKYYIAPGQGNEMVVTLEIILQDDSKVIEEHVFRIKNLKKHIARINNKNCQNCIVLMKKEELKDAEISFYLEDFLYEFLNLKVTSFDLYIHKKKKFHIEGNKITEEVYKEILKLKKGKEIIIYNIEFKLLSELNIFIHPIGIIQIQISDF